MKIDPSEHPSIIKSYVEDGVDTVELATRYGVGPSTIGRILFINGVDVRRRSKVLRGKREEIQKMINDGRKVREIAKELGCSVTLIYRNFTMPKPDVVKRELGPKQREILRGHRGELAILRDKLAAFRKTEAGQRQEESLARQIEALEYFL